MSFDMKDFARKASAEVLLFLKKLFYTLVTLMMVVMTICVMWITVQVGKYYKQNPIGTNGNASSTPKLDAEINYDLITVLLGMELFSLCTLAVFGMYQKRAFLTMPLVIFQKLIIMTLFVAVMVPVYRNWLMHLIEFFVITLPFGVLQMMSVSNRLEGDEIRKRLAVSDAAKKLKNLFNAKPAKLNNGGRPISITINLTVANMEMIPAILATGLKMCPAVRTAKAKDATSGVEARPIVLTPPSYDESVTDTKDGATPVTNMPAPPPYSTKNDEKSKTVYQIV